MINADMHCSQALAQEMHVISWVVWLVSDELTEATRHIRFSHAPLSLFVSSRRSSGYDLDIFDNHTRRAIQLSHIHEYVAS